MKKLIFVFVLLFARPVVAGDLLDAIAALTTDPTPDPNYGPVWHNYDGLSVWDHLAEDHHAGKIIGNYRSLTHSQAVDLHSDLHNTGRTLNAADYGSQTVQVATYGPLEDALQSQSCANGNCPLRYTPVRSASRAGAAVASRTVSRSRTIVGRARSWRPLRRWFGRSRGLRVGRIFGRRSGC